MLATPVVPMRHELRHDVWQAVTVAASTAAKPGPRYVRPMLIGLVLAGAAAAALLMLDLSPQRENATVNVPGRWTQAPAEVVAQAGGTTALEPFEGTAAGQPRADGSIAAQLQKKRIVVLPTRHEITDRTGIDNVDTIRTAVVRHLRGRADLDVVEITEAEEAGVPMFFAALRDAIRTRLLPEGFAYPHYRRDLAVASHYDAYAAIRLSSQLPRRPPDEPVPPELWSIEISQADRGDGDVFTSSVWSGEDLEAQGRTIARRIYSNLVEPELAIDAYASEIADARSSDEERLRAFWEAQGVVIPAIRAGEPPSAAFLAAATELGHSSASAETRRWIWGGLGSIPHMAATLPLLDALVTERDAGVRQVIVRSLRESTFDQRVRAALESAAAGDPSSMVRRDARWLLLSAAEQRAFFESTLHDSSLLPEERLATLLFARLTSRPIYDAVVASDDEAIALLVDTVRTSTDSSTRSDAINALEGNPALIEPMLESLASTDASVRRTALNVLARTYRGMPAVVEAVRRALESELDARVRFEVEQALSRPRYEPWPPR